MTAQAPPAAAVGGGAVAAATAVHGEGDEVKCAAATGVPLSTLGS
jgi:hypothetical protein